MRISRENRELTTRIRWYMLARLILISAIMGISPFALGLSSTPFFVIIGFLYCATVVYSLLLKTRIPLRLQAYAQFFVDSSIVTVLLASTGGVDSDFVLLYVLSIICASMVIGGQAGLVIAVSSSAMYAGLGFLNSFDLLPPDLLLASTLTGDPLYTGYMVTVRAIIFCILGYLGDYLVNSLYSNRLELAELKKVNENILSQLRGGLISTDAYGKIIFVNPVAEEILGYRKHEMVGKSWHVFLGHPIEDIDDRWLAEEARSFTRCEIKVRRKDGSEIPIGFTISSLMDREGILLGLLVLFRDLTQIHRMEERMRRADRLSAAGAILASVAHEVRTPLAALRGAVEVLGEGGAAPGTVARLMKVILKESDRLNRIVGDFVSYSSPGARQRNRVDLNAVLEEALVLISEGRKLAAGVQIVRDNGNSPLCVEADPYQMKQVFINILDNALDALRGNGTVSIGVAVFTPPGGKRLARVRIADNGEGMSAERMTHLFEPFYSTKESGTGMGLFIAERIVRDHGGQLEVESREGGGTVFTVTLPCVGNGNKDAR